MTLNTWYAVICELVMKLKPNHTKSPLPMPPGYTLYPMWVLSHRRKPFYIRICTCYFPEKVKIELSKGDRILTALLVVDIAPFLSYPFPTHLLLSPFFPFCPSPSLWMYLPGPDRSPPTLLLIALMLLKWLLLAHWACHQNPLYSSRAIFHCCKPFMHQSNPG